MSRGRTQHGGAIERRYGGVAAGEWQRLLSHVAFADNFELLVLAVPDVDGASLCRTELETFLRERDRRLHAFEAAAPAELPSAAKALLEKRLAADAGAVWLAGVPPVAAADFSEWQTAWRRTLEGLNQQRNPLRRHLECPVVMAVAPWVIPLFRDVAPDLWSVRSQVVHIEPGAERTGRSVEKRVERAPRAERVGRDPALAMREVERLRGVPGRERELASMLERAARGFLDRGEAGQAESLLREALELAEAGGDTATSRGITMDMLGRAILDQSRAAEAEAVFRRALELAEAGGATATSRGITMHELGRAILDQSRAAEAEAVFRRALELAEAGGATATSRGITMDMLGRAILDQSRAAEAEAAFRRALELKEAGGATATSRGITMDMLGRAILDQGRAAEAEQVLARARQLLDGGAG